MSVFEINSTTAEWIAPDKYEYNEFDSVDRKYAYLLTERQIYFRPGALKEYFRSIVRIVKSDDFPLVNPVQLTINPDYEKCYFHFYRIIRNNKVKEVAPELQFKEIQREAGLEQHLYTGLKTYLAHIEGLQINDIIEYAYSIVNTNRLYKSHFTLFYQTTFGIPVWRLKLAVDYENPDKICTVRIANNFSEAKTETITSGQKFQFQKDLISPVALEDFIPLSENPFSFIEFSDYRDWNEFGNDLLNEYKGNDAGDLYLEEYVNKITSAAEPDKKIEAVINYVKTDIAYLSITIDEHSFIPHAPYDVVRQNFGDCKDKSLLLKILLNYLGVASHVILVNTLETKNLDKRLISIGCFNHAMICMEYEGINYYIDPTDSYSLFRFKNSVERDYGYYLDTESFRFLKFEKVKNNIFKRVIEEKFVINGNNAIIKVQDGYYFQSFREAYTHFLKNDNETTVRNYLDYYKNRYPNLEVLENEKPEYVIDFGEQRIVFNISFNATNIWQEHETHHDRLSFLFSPNFLYEYLINPTSQYRRYNHIWPHPVDLRYIFDIDYDYDTKMGDLSNEIVCASFNCTIRTIEKHRNYKYELHYVSKKNRINPENYESEKKEINQFMNECGFRILKQKVVNTPTSPSIGENIYRNLWVIILLLYLIFCYFYSLLSNK